MAEVLGPLTLQNKALPLGVDGTRIAQWAMRDGVTYGELVNLVSLALGAVNERLLSKWGWLFNITEELVMEYEDGGANKEMDELTDIDTPIAVHGSTIGHMLPFRSYGQGIAGSKHYFRDVRSVQVQAAISAVARRGLNRFERLLINRAFSNTEEAIGASGYSVPFVRGTGGNIDFTPVAFDGVAFANTHNHFIGYNLSTPLAMDAVLEGLAATLAEHGHSSPYTALVSRTDTALFNALLNKVILVEGVMQIDRGGVTSGPQFFANGQQTLERVGSYQSSLGQIELIASGRIPTGHVFMTKSYGVNNPQNALAVRVHPQVGFGLSVVPETIPDNQYPVKQLNVEFEFGIGVGQDRTNGAAGFLVAGGTWAAPVIT